MNEKRKILRFKIRRDARRLAGTPVGESPVGESSSQASDVEGATSETGSGSTVGRTPSAIVRPDYRGPRGRH